MILCKTRRLSSTRLCSSKRRQVGQDTDRYAAVSRDDIIIVITLYQVPGENISFGQGEARRQSRGATAPEAGTVSADTSFYSAPNGVSP